HSTPPCPTPPRTPPTHHPFSFSSRRPHRDLHSFPTRRSSDLRHDPQPRAQNADDDRADPQPEQPPRDRPGAEEDRDGAEEERPQDRKSTRLNSSHVSISYAVFCLKKKKYKVSSSSQVLQYIWYLGPTVSILRSIYFS